MEQGLATFHETAAERDALRDEVTASKATSPRTSVALEAKDAQMADMESRVNTMMLERDEAVARRAEVETVLGSMMALGRAFQIENAPLVRERDEMRCRQSAVRDVPVPRIAVAAVVLVLTVSLAPAPPKPPTDV